MSCCHAPCFCHGCSRVVDRRGFLKGCGAAAFATAGALTPRAGAGAAAKSGRVRIAAVFLLSMNTKEIWPYPGFDVRGRQHEILARLRTGCPEIDFIPVCVEDTADVRKAVALQADVDGYLVYTMTLVWNQRGAVVEIGKLGKPLVVADEFLGGSGVFLTGTSDLARSGIPAVAVSTTELSDLVTVARQFADVRAPGMTPAVFTRQCERVYRGTFPPRSTAQCTDDSPELTDIGPCVERFRASRFLIVGRGRGGEEQDFLGAKGRYVDFDELNAFYAKVDRDAAAAWAARWSEQAQDLPPGAYIEPRQPGPDAVRNAAGIYLATLKLLAQYQTDNVTMDCLGGFATGKLPAYPCLGFMQLLNDGGQGVCEAMPNDTVSMLMARILTGRPGFVSDPALDTAKNQIVYAHCVGTTKVFGPAGRQNDFYIRTLHNRDPRGACAESLMPAGYMTTSFRASVERKQMVIHQAAALGPLSSEKGCRTKLLGEVRGDIGKLFNQWDQFGWHRVTVYGDVKEPLAEFGKALGLEVLEEA